MKITYAAVSPAGDVFTRTSGTMSYTHVVLVQNVGNGAWGTYSWHTTPAAAYKVTNAGGRLGASLARFAKVLAVPVEAIELTGKARAAKLAELGRANA